jgi:hypothetical protein
VRILVLVAGLLLTTASVAACNPRRQAGPYETTFRDSFEAGLGDWQTGADVPEDGERPGPVDWFIQASESQSSDGQSSAEFFLDGKHDDGTIWLFRPFTVPAGQDLTVTLSFDAWSESESFNTTGKVAAYAGARKPQQEGDFDLSQALNQVTGWKRYSYSLEASSGDDGQLWVAVGITAVWETKLTYYFDNLLVEIEAGQ